VGTVVTYVAFLNLSGRSPWRSDCPRFNSISADKPEESSVARASQRSGMFTILSRDGRWVIDCVYSEGAAKKSNTLKYRPF
jgi:hypothetical protein